jgi:ArsR family transcriptional regulator
MKPAPLANQVLIHKALGHPARLRILVMLREKELCVCQITAVLQLATSTVSAHLTELKHAALVEERKDGRWVHYRLTPTAEAALSSAVGEGLEQDPQVALDREILRRLVEIPVEQICRPDFSLAPLLGAARRACCQSRRSEVRT